MNYDLFGASIIFAIYGIYETNQAYKEFKGLNPTIAQDFPVGHLIDDDGSFTSKSLRNSYDAPEITKNLSTDITIETPLIK